MREKRSSEAENAQLDLFGLGDAGGVGARQARSSTPARGGGYLQTCIPPDFSNSGASGAEKKRGDPRMDELRAIGLPSVWMRIAERVGFDAWMDIWRMVSEEEGVRHDGGARLPKLREYSAYLRYQRNLYIEDLARLGYTPKMIQEALRKNLREFLDISNINKIARRVRIRA